MTRKLVVGGAGFIGSRVVDTLIGCGEDVTVLDRAEHPTHLPREIRYIEGQAADRDAVVEALNGVDAVVLIAGRTGVGESVKHPNRYYHDNALAFRQLLSGVRESGTVEQVIAASSMYAYGEGKYRCEDCGIRFPGSRSPGQLEAEAWEHSCSCGNLMQVVPLTEDDPSRPQDPYARSKHTMEHMVRDLSGAAVDTTILRYPVVYGPRQGGAMDYFFSTAVDGGQPRLFEDGQQLRDFLFVDDVAAATAAALNGNHSRYNLGTGEAVELSEFVSTVLKLAGNDRDIDISGDFRTYDVRHSVPEVSRFRAALNITPTARETAIQNTLEYYQ